MNNMQNKTKLSNRELRRREHNRIRAEKRRMKMPLSGSRQEWYNGFLMLGLSPEEAKRRAWDPNRREVLSSAVKKSTKRIETSCSRDSSSTRSQDFDSTMNTMDTMEYRVRQNRKVIADSLHFDPEEARGKVMHHRTEQMQPQLTDYQTSNEQSDKDLEIYCKKHGLTGVERTRFIQSMQKSRELKFAPNAGNSFRLCLEGNSIQTDHQQNYATSSNATSEADEGETNKMPVNPEGLYCKINKIQGSGRKWFKRYLKQGCDLEEAHKKLLERRALQRRLELPPEEQKKIYVWRRDSRPTTSTAAAVENKTKAPLLNNPDEHNRVTQMALIPKEYPKEILKENDLSALENAVIEELARGWDVPLKFKGINFGSGMLLVDCENFETAKWLTHVAPQLKAWRGVALRACPKNNLPNPYTVSMYLPNSAGQDVNSIFAMIKSQNDGLNISTWKLLNLREHGKDQTLIISIDQSSWDTIASNQNVIRYGFGIVRVQKKY